MFEKLIIKLSGIDCTKKNPINYDNLLRSPGQSVDEELDKFRDKILTKVSFIFTLTIVYIIMIPILNFPVYSHILAVVIFWVYIIFLLSKNIQKLRNYKLGRDGEKA